jgi:hypothetical protein
MIGETEGMRRASEGMRSETERRRRRREGMRIEKEEIDEKMKR